MADLARIKRNVRKMADQGAPEQDIDGYIASEGVTVDDVRGFQEQPTSGSIGIDTFPDVETRAQRQADLNERVAGQTGAGELFGNSFTLGLQDKVAGLAGGVSGLIKGEGFGEGYSVGRRAQEILEERARERSGKLGTAAEIGGSVASGVLAKAPAAASVVGRILQGGKEAGILGIGQGLGDSQADTLQGTAGDMLMGGATSAALGSALTGAVEAGRGLIAGGRAVKRGLTSTLDDEQGKAARKVYQSLIDDGLSPEQAAARMRTRNTALINTADENVLGLGRAASAKPGEGRTVLNKALDAQQRGSRGRVVQAADNALGANGGPTFNQRVGDMIDSRAGLASQQYDEAFRQNFARGHSPVFDDLAKRVPGEAVRNAQKIAQAEGRPFGQQLVASIDDAGNVTFRRAPSLQEWHYIQRGLRAAKDTAYKSGVGEVGTAYNSLHKQILGAMDNASPLYKTARTRYASQSQLIEALERGREILNPATTRNVDALADDLANMSRAEREMVRMGLARQIQDMIEATPDTAGDMVKKIFGTQGKRSAIRAAFDSPADFRRFEAEMGRVARETKSYRYVRTGSRTSFVDAEKQNAGNLADAAGVAMDAATGGVANATIRGLMKLLRDSGGMDPAVAREVAELLVERDPSAVLKALAPAAKQAGRQAATNALLGRARALVRAGTVGGSAELGSMAVEQRR